MKWVVIGFGMFWLSFFSMVVGSAVEKREMDIAGMFFGISLLGAALTVVGALL